MKTMRDDEDDEGGTLPLVTLALIAYNQEEFISEAIEGVLSQTYSPLQIILSDDCSSDRTFEIMQAMSRKASHPGGVVLNRNLRNLGICAHVNRVMEMATGEAIALAAGDDICLPGRVARSVEILQAHPFATMVGFRDITIDKHSIEVPRMDTMTRENGYSIVRLSDYVAGKTPHLSGASRCFRRELFDAFHALNDSCPAEDVPCLLRGLMLGYGVIAPEPGIRYRLHENNLSGPRSLHAMSFLELAKQYEKDLAVAIDKKLVSMASARQVRRWIRKTYKRRVFLRGLYFSQHKRLYFATKVMANTGMSLRERLSIAKRLLDRRRPFVCDL